MARAYGAGNPAFTASYSGLLNGDTAAVVSRLALTTTATTASNVGAYIIVASGGTAANYIITDTNGTLTVNPALLTIAANNASRQTGAADPAFTAQYAGLVNADTAAVVSGLSIRSTASANSPAGAYPITPSGGSAANYTVAYTPGTLTLAPTPTPTVTNVAGVTIPRPANIVVPTSATTVTVSGDSATFSLPTDLKLTAAPTIAAQAPVIVCGPAASVSVPVRSRRNSMRS